jgi:hypothetical protein
MKTFIVELITNESLSNRVEITCENLRKVDYQNILIDGVLWTVPKEAGMSFAEVTEEK